MSTQNLKSDAAVGIDAKAFRDGMSKVVAAVHIITIRDQEVILGTTATAVCSVSDSPPTLLVCLHRQGRVYNAIRTGMDLTVNTLAKGHDELANIFAGAGTLSMPERFAHGRWDSSSPGAPMLRDGVVCFQTKVDQIIEACSHSIILCRVESIVDNDTQSSLPPSALLYGARHYRTVALDTTQS